MTDEIRFLVAMGAWLGFCAVAVLIYWRTPARERNRRFRQFCIIGAITFIIVAYGTTGKLSVLYFAVPMITFITALNLKIVRFCPDCGAYYQRLGRFYPNNFCRKCGRNLIQAEEPCPRSALALPWIKCGQR